MKVKFISPPFWLLLPVYFLLLLPVFFILVLVWLTLVYYRFLWLANELPLAWLPDFGKLTACLSGTSGWLSEKK